MIRRGELTTRSFYLAFQLIIIKFLNLYRVRISRCRKEKGYAMYGTKETQQS